VGRPLHGLLPDNIVDGHPVYFREQLDVIPPPLRRGRRTATLILPASSPP
jgi:hypothetical protein